MLSIANAAVYECPCAAAAATHASRVGKGSFPWVTQFPSSIIQYLLTLVGVVVSSARANVAISCIAINAKTGEALRVVPMSLRVVVAANAKNTIYIHSRYIM